MTRHLAFTCGLIIAIAASSCQKREAQPGTAEAGAAAASSVTKAETFGPAADWPAFHNGGPLLGVATEIGPPPMRVRWTYKGGDEVAAAGTQPAAQQGGLPPSYEASAAIVNGVVFIGNRAGALVAIDARTGHRKWAYIAEAGFSASPAVLNGIVYIGDEDGVFHAVRADTGKKIWTFDAAAGIHSSANFSGDRVVFGTDGADIFCLAASDGTKLWSAKAGDRINGAPAIGGSPASAFVSGCDAQLRALNVADGAERFAKDMGALCPGSPAIAPGRIVIGTDGGKVVCFSEDGQNELWSFDGVGESAMVYGSPAVADGIVVVGARDRNVYGLDLATGRKIWSFPTRGDVDSSAVISGNRVYVASKDKRLYVLDLHTGNKLWDFVTTRGVTATPAVGEGVVVIGDTGGSLFCLEPAGK